MYASIRESQLRAGDKILDGRRDEHLSRFRDREQPGADMNGDAAQLPIYERAFACVHAGTNLDAKSNKCIGDCASTSDCARRAVEYEQKSIAGVVLLPTPKATEGPAHDSVVLGDQFTPFAVFEFGRTRGRADHIREEHRGEDGVSGHRHPAHPKEPLDFGDHRVKVPSPRHRIAAWNY